jgi:nucleosome assembly protein 1-like 1
MVEERNKHLETLTEEQKVIIKELEKYQTQIDEVLNKFEKKNEEVTKKYELLKEPFYKERNEYINGEKENSTRIPTFWITVLKNSDLFDINKRDEECLKFLKCISLVEKEEIEIIFEFEENPFFENKTLTKTFQETLQTTKGTKIEWKEGNNLQLKRVLKKPKGKKKPNEKVVESFEPCESFFNFFDESNEEVAEDDFEVLEILKESILPNAVQYYLGENEDEEEEEDESDSDEEKETIILTSDDWDY